MMKLDRDIPENKGRGKYALLLLRTLEEKRKQPEIRAALETLEKAGVIDFSPAGSPGEFFVIRLKDRYAWHALEAYANEAGKDDVEYADAIRDLADRAGEHSAFCKRPD
jgi:hypothetical protein